MFKITFEGIGVDKMSNNKKTAYPAEFKESAVKLALESGNSIAQTTRKSPDSLASLTADPLNSAG